LTVITFYDLDLLNNFDVTKIRKAAPNCDRLFTTLAQVMGETI
jgi:hypothetical protein